MIDFSKKPLFLAPLAGFSDLPLRSVARHFGADVSVSEMISANALVYEGRKSLELAQRGENEDPFIVQIAGSDPENLKKAVLILNELDGVAGIDFNCGCPVPKVVRQSSGSALLKDLDLLSRLVETIKKHSNKPLTSVKFRLGFDEKIPQKIALACQRAGADYVCIHGRTRAGGYSAPVDYEAIGLAKSVVNIPVVANGDIDAQNAAWVLEKTGCDGLMIGRASIGRPWIFAEIKGGASASAELRAQVVLAHFDAMLKRYGLQGVSIFRKHLHQYSKGMAGASAFRDEINRINSASESRALIEEFFKGALGDESLSHSKVGTV